MVSFVEKKKKGGENFLLFNIKEWRVYITIIGVVD